MKYLLLLLISVNVFANTQTTTIETNTFKIFIEDIKKQGVKQNISTQTLTILDSVQPIKRVLELDNSQAEFSLNFWQYVSTRVSPNRILLGGLEMQKNPKTFQEVYNKYGVPKHILIAFYGLESNFGVNTGSFKLVDSLATLAFDKRRRSFFTQQLLTTLKLIDEKKLDKDTKSSWAGAMGSVQFMPTNVATYGIDVGKDGKIDLWEDSTDIFHSAGYFLSKIGWNKGEKWGREVILPKKFDYSLADLKIKKSLSYWDRLGVKTVSGKKLPNSTLNASLVLPMGYKGPAFLVYRNFRAIMNWNRSTLYALSVGILANRLTGVKLKAKFIDEKKISKKDVKFVQQTLQKSGFDVGKIDGIAGKKTRDAIRKYQKKYKITPDGYLGQELIAQMKKLNVAKKTSK